MTNQDWNDSEEAWVRGDQSLDKKPIAKSVEKKLTKLRQRLARKEAEERVAYGIPPSDIRQTPKHQD
jgi:hypothetical protein